MKYTAILSLVVVACLGAWQARAAEPSFEEILKECLPGISAAAIPDRQPSEQRLQDACYQVSRPGHEAERAAACTLLASKLEPDMAKPARVWLLRQLTFIGGEESVAALATLLTDQDAEVRDWACRALAHNPAPQANVRLLAALSQAQDEAWKVALVNALGARGDAASAAALASSASSPQQSVALAAAEALGKLGTPEALKALEAVRAGAAGALRVELGEASLRCAERLLAEGKTAEAATLYETLAAASEPRPVRLGALQGRLQTAGPKAAALVLQWLGGSDEDARAIAGGAIAQLPKGDAGAALVAGYAKLPPSGKILLVAGLAARGDKEAAPLALEALKSDVPELKQAGLLALAKVGNSVCVPQLTAMLEAGGELGATANECLKAMIGAGVDEMLVTVYQGASPKLRGNLIGLLEERRAGCAVPVLLQQVADANPQLRGEATRALATIAQPDALPELVALLTKVDAGRERDEVEKAIMQVAARTPDRQQRAAAVLARLEVVDEAETCVLLPVLGRIGGEEARAVIAKAQKSPQADVREAALRALCNWPDASVASELMTAATVAAGKDARLRALRAYIRVVSLPSDRPATETLKLLQAAWDKATRTEEKKLILSRASSARCLETFQWVLPQLDSPELVREASLAVVELAHHRELMGPHQAEFRAALKKVTEVCKDPEITDRAKRYLEGL